MRGKVAIDDFIKENLSARVKQRVFVILISEKSVIAVSFPTIVCVWRCDALPLRVDQRVLAVHFDDRCAVDKRTGIFIYRRNRPASLRVDVAVELLDLTVQKPRRLFHAHAEQPLAVRPADGKAVYVQLPAVLE